MSDERGSEIRTFLRAMRARLRPEDVGLPVADRRRRATGLRIEETAALAGVSLTWYSALERGKEIGVSLALLQRVGDALRLDGPEREMLATLAGPKRFTAPASDDDGSLRAVVNGFSAGPAFVTDRFWNVLVFNAIADAVYDLSNANENNLLSRVLIDPAMRTLHRDWERIARQMIAIAHFSLGQSPEDERGIALVRTLERTSPEFARWWGEYHIGNFVPTTARLDHATMGRLSLVYAGFVATAMRSASDPLVIVFQPAGDAPTERKIRQLARP